MKGVGAAMLLIGIGILFTSIENESAIGCLTAAVCGLIAILEFLA